MSTTFHERVGFEVRPTFSATVSDDTAPDLAGLRQRRAMWENGELVEQGAVAIGRIAVNIDFLKGLQHRLKGANGFIPLHSDLSRKGPTLEVQALLGEYQAPIRKLGQLLRRIVSFDGQRGGLSDSTCDMVHIMGGPYVSKGSLATELHVDRQDDPRWRYFVTLAGGATSIAEGRLSKEDIAPDGLFVTNPTKVASIQYKVGDIVRAEELTAHAAPYSTGEVRLFAAGRSGPVG